jgi:hypothetical protein
MAYGNNKDVELYALHLDLQREKMEKGYSQHLGSAQQNKMAELVREQMFRNRGVPPPSPLMGSSGSDISALGEPVYQTTSTEWLSEPVGLRKKDAKSTNRKLLLLEGGTK